MTGEYNQGMITAKANAKLMTAVLKTKTPEAREALAVMVAANNILITDITKKGEIVFETKPAKVELK